MTDLLVEDDGVLATKGVLSHRDTWILQSDRPNGHDALLAPETDQEVACLTPEALGRFVER